MAPDGSTDWVPHKAQTQSALVRALANAHRWLKMLDSGDYATVGELAAALELSPSHLSRLLRQTLLAPAIVEAILDGRHPMGLTLRKLKEPLPAEWEAQRKALLPSY